MNKVPTSLIALALFSCCLCPGVCRDGRAQEGTRARPSFALTIEGVRGLIKDSNYAAAESAARELLKETESLHGADSREVADVLNALVESLWRGGKAKEPESRQLAERDLALREQILGPDHPDVASSLNNFGNLLKAAGDFEGARPLYERALAIREKAHGPEHPNVAWCLNNLASLLSDTGDFAGAKKMNERALAIREKALGPEHPDVALSLNNLANLLRNMGDYEAAKKAFERSIAIREKALGSEHLDLAQSLNGLGALLLDMGQYADAKPLIERSMAIREKALGPEHPQLGFDLNALGYLLLKMGDYTASKPLLERSLAIREKALGPEHHRVAWTLNNLAILLSSTGDNEGARRLYERALAIREKALGPDHPLVGQILGNIAALLVDTGDYPGAKAYFERSLAIKEKKLGPEHPDVASGLNHLAAISALMGDYQGVKPLFERSLAIRMKALGPEHPKVAESFRNLAIFSFMRGDYAEAGPLFDRGLAIEEKAYGPDHPELAETLHSMTDLYMATKNFKRAFEIALRAEEITREHFRLTAGSLPEDQALRYAAARTSGLDVILSVSAKATGGPSKDPVWSPRAWDALIRSRAMVLDEMAERNRTVAEAHRISRTAQRFATASQHLANLVVRGAGTDLPEDYRRTVDEARKEKEMAERALAESSHLFRIGQTLEKAGLEEVMGAVPPGCGLVAYARYFRVEVAAPLAVGKEPESTAGTPAADIIKKTPTYLAFVLPPGRNVPVPVDLGNAEEIDRLVSRWRTEAGRRPTGGEEAYREAGARLRKVVWDPVAQRLGKVKRVFVVPDGELHVLNLASLPVGGDTYLIENGPLIHYLSAERDLVLAGPRTRPAEGLLLVGNPAFDEKSLFSSFQTKTGSEQNRSLIAKLAEHLPFRGLRSECDDLDTLSFGPLPETAVEMSELAGLWREVAPSSPIVELAGDRANEALLKENAPMKRILHIATHGFFLEHQCRPPGGRESRGVNGSAAQDVKTAPATENPLRLSGLALAGFNHRGAAGLDEEDGVLTAEEIAAMDLSGVEWAVLSACETGLGEVRASEGVFGLRRAFKVAGAGTLIMSLWSIEDQATREWMGALYEARLLGRMDTAEAVREASLGVLKGRREAGKTTHPFYWAAFVAAGDWK